MTVYFPGYLKAMQESIITYAAIVASVLHAIAYLIYLRYAFLEEVRPNPTSWLMWAYGTALVILLEWDQEASRAVILLPVVCAVCSIIVALFCWRRGRLRWPEVPSDRAAFMLDLVFTALYVFLIVFDTRGLISTSDEVFAKSILLILAGGSTLLSYWPILRSTRRNPQNEHWLAWAIWTVAYLILLVVTIATHGNSFDSIQFWVYPSSCLVLTGAVGFYALRSDMA